MTRKDYDFKNGVPVTLEPTFQERLQAIKLLRDTADDENKASSIQFINNILAQPGTKLPEPNITAPTEPPPGHYSLSLDPDKFEKDLDGEEAF